MGVALVLALVDEDAVEHRLGARVAAAREVRGVDLELLAPALLAEVDEREEAELAEPREQLLGVGPRRTARRQARAGAQLAGAAGEHRGVAGLVEGVAQVAGAPRQRRRGVGGGHQIEAAALLGAGERLELARRVARPAPHQRGGGAHDHAAERVDHGADFGAARGGSRRTHASRSAHWVNASQRASSAP